MDKKMKATWRWTGSLVPSGCPGTAPADTYAGRIVDADLNRVWECWHPHATREAAVACAQAKLQQYPSEIVCPREGCNHLADNIGDDSRGRQYYSCAECGGEWLLPYDAPELKRVPLEPLDTEV